MSAEWVLVNEPIPWGTKQLRDAIAAGDAYIVARRRRKDWQFYRRRQTRIRGMR